MACEIAAEGVIAARSGDGDIIDLSSVRTLPSGALAPSLTAANVVNRELVRRAVQEALAPVTNRSRDLILVLPDAACRVVLLDFESLPDKPEEASAVIGFRLNKSLPFEVSEARISYQVQPGDNGSISVVAAVIMKSVLQEYESVVREAGYTPGVVLPSVLAALGQVDASVPTLVMKIDTITTSVAIVDQDRLLLVRTLDNPVGARPDPEQLAEDAYPSLVFYQDTYGTKVQKILVNGVGALDGLSTAIEEHTGIRAQELVSAAQIDSASGKHRAVLGGVVGALARNS